VPTLALWLALVALGFLLPSPDLRLLAAEEVAVVDLLTVPPVVRVAVEAVEHQEQ
jgi:hypothetical protein